MPYKDYEYQKKVTAEREARWRKENPELYKLKRKKSDKNYYFSEKGTKQRKEYYLKHKDKFLRRAKLSRTKIGYSKLFNRNKYRLNKELGRCEGCGTDSNLNTHHILVTPNSHKKIDENWNLMLLCGDCHRKVHSLFGQKQNYLTSIIRGLVGTTS